MWNFVGGEEDVVRLQEGCGEEIAEGVVFAGEVKDGRVGDA